MGNFLRPPYVVLLGDVGTGKSTLVEKLTGESGRSSDSSMSYTRSSEVFWVPDGSLIIADTPGSNALEDKLEHNIWIAGALNYMPVSRILLKLKLASTLSSATFANTPIALWNFLWTWWRFLSLTWICLRLDGQRRISRH